MDALIRLICRAVGALAGLFIFLLSLTWRVSIRGEDVFNSAPRAVFVFWHSWILTLYPIHRNRAAVVLVSKSRDGEIASGALELGRWYRVVRGSSSRGGLEAFFTLLKFLRSGNYRVAIPADGPRGPAGKVKSGAALLAKRAGVPLVPVEVKATPVFRFNSWDRTALPLPFARVEVVYHKPIDLTGSLEEISICIEKKLGKL